LIHDNTTKVAVVNLSLFEGNWVECTEVIKIGAAGTYSLNIKRISDGTQILSYSKDNIMTIRADNNFIRPKWGIYRSLLHPEDLRDEAVRFDGFFIQEGEVSGIEKINEMIPESFSLEQNYPNPFNPSTIIRFAIPIVGALSEVETQVTLKVYDVLGREVAVLVNEQKSPGNYEVTFNGSNLSSGIYICRMKSGKFSKSIKLTLTK
jgi:hypothetical protein